MNVGAQQRFISVRRRTTHDILVAISGGPTHPTTVDATASHTHLCTQPVYPHPRSSCDFYSCTPRGRKGEGAHGRERSPSHPFLLPHVKRHGRRLNKHHSLRTNPGSAQALVTQQWCTWVGVGKGGVWQKKGKGGCAGASAMRSGLARSGREGGKRKGSLPLCSVTRKERRKKAEKKKAHIGARIFSTLAFGGGGVMLLAFTMGKERGGIS